MENQKLNLGLNVLKIALAVLGVVFSIMAMAGGSVNPALYLSYIGIAIAVLFVVVFALKAFVESLKSSKTTLIAVVALAVVFGISYATASSDVPASFAEIATPGDFKWSGTGITLMYLLLGGTVIAVLYAEVSKLLK